MKQSTAALMVLAMCTPLPAQTREDTDREFISPADVSSQQVDTPDLAKSVELVVERTNSFRQEEQLDPLTVNKQLTATAQEFADFMARTDKYGHHADDRSPAERATAQEYEFCLIAENIAYQYNSRGFTAESLASGFVEGWKESPGHRRNMLEPAATETGVAMARSDKSGNYYAVQLFGRPRSAQIAFQIRNQRETEVEYKVGERSFTLPSGFTREHRQCSQVTLTISLNDATTEAKPAFEIQNGARYAVSSTGEVRVEAFELRTDESESEERRPSPR